MAGKMPLALSVVRGKTQPYEVLWAQAQDKPVGTNAQRTANGRFRHLSHLKSPCTATQERNLTLAGLQWNPC
jgi:hypothetical protein